MPETADAPHRLETLPLVRIVRRGGRSELEMVERNVRWVREYRARTVIFRDGKKVGDGQRYTDNKGYMSAIGDALDIVRMTAKAYCCGPKAWHTVEMRVIAACIEVPFLADGSPLPDGLFRRDDERIQAWRTARTERRRTWIPLPPLEPTILQEMVVWSSHRSETENGNSMVAFTEAAAWDAQPLSESMGMRSAA